MTAFTIGHASSNDWKRAADTCLAQLGSDSGTLGFIYVTDPYAPQLAVITEYMRDRTGIGDWIGTVGLGVCCTGTEYYDRPALVTMVTDLPEEQYRVFGPVKNDLGEFTRQHCDWITHTHALVGVVHADPYQRDTPALIRDLARELNHGFLVGGLTSAQRGCPQVCNTLADGGLSGAIFAGDVAISCGLSQGCSPLAAPHEITQSEGNILISLDNRPALEVFKEDIGELLARDLEKVGGYIFAGLPIHASDTGDYLVRNLVGIDPERNLIAVGETVSAGQPVMFCRRDSGTARDDLQRMLDDLRMRAGQPRGGLYFSCLARGRNMFGDNSAELKLIQRTLGDVPLVGFYANGEISHDRLYAYTGVLTLFS